MDIKIRNATLSSTTIANNGQRRRRCARNTHTHIEHAALEQGKGRVGVSHGATVIDSDEQVNA